MSSTIHLQPPFRAEHIGSLLRPKALFEKRQQLESKQCNPSDLKPVEDDAIKQIVELQRNVGIKTITDGELRRLSWISTSSLPCFDFSAALLHRSYFFDGVFDKLEGMIHMPDRKFHSSLPSRSCLSFVLRSHRDVQGRAPSILSS